MVRTGTDIEKLRAFMRELGQRAHSRGRVYLTGGASALLLGIRPQTIDIDIKLDPEPAGVFEAIAELKETLGVNIKLAAPDQFLPPVPGWEDRSEHIETVGSIEFYHYDFYGQALSKILRGHSKDISDARSLAMLGKVGAARLLVSYTAIEEGLIRYPSINASHFKSRVEAFVESLRVEDR